MKQAAPFAIVAAALICVAAVCGTSGYAKGWMDGYESGITNGTQGVQELMAAVGQPPVDWSSPENQQALEKFKSLYPSTIEPPSPPAQ